MAKMLMEVCCGSAEDALEAFKAGADRVELNSNLFQGGLTPTLGSLLVVKEHTDKPVMTMVRPRAGGFMYTRVEYLTALKDAELLLKNGADGLVFGFLNADGTVDKKRTCEMVRLCGDKQAVFHRALDVTPDWKRALDTLMEAGVIRVLTSGQEPDVFFALDTIKEMVAYANGRIQILPGAGITLKNARRVAAYTGVEQVHLARHKRLPDPSVKNNADIYFGGALYPPEDSFELIDGAYISAVRDTLL